MSDIDLDTIYRANCRTIDVNRSKIFQQVLSSFSATYVLACVIWVFGTNDGIAQNAVNCSPGLADLPAADLQSVPISAFINSLGVNLHIDQGYDPASYLEPLRYLGIRKARDGSRHLERMVSLANATGVKFSVVSGGDIEGYVETLRKLSRANALLAIEGPNEPNNFPIIYKGKKGGLLSDWLVVAEYQRDLYARVKADPDLRSYPVFGPSEMGAETENVGLQFLTIPETEQSLLPAGTRFADYANVHNYVSGVRPADDDNQAWNAADPTLRGRWDGLAGNHGITWRRGFRGYTNAQLEGLPRVTTETGADAGPDLKEQHRQGVILTNTYLAQFARGWAYTFIYELRDNEGGASLQGLYAGKRPKLAATYIHNLTSILAEKSGETSGEISAQSGHPRLQTASQTVHALSFLRGDGKHFVVVWSERVSGSDVSRISLPGRHQVTLYDITSGDTPVATLAATSEVCLTTTDHAVILEY